MVQLNNTDKQMTLKVVYVGCALGGKTTSLERLHQRVQQTQRSRLFSLNTANDRTLFFDLLPLDVGQVSGYTVRLQLFTVPGQAQYASTRRAVLAGADAVVVVVDSEASRAQDNRDAMRDLAEHLKFHGLDIRSIPLVLQYNKRDLPEALGRQMLDGMLNSRNWPVYETTATVGTGVVEAFVGVVELMCEELAIRHGLPRALPGRVAAALGRLLPEISKPSASRPEDLDFPTLHGAEVDGPAERGSGGLPSGLWIQAAPELPELAEPAEAEPRHLMTRASIGSNTAVSPEILLQGALEAQQSMALQTAELDKAREALRLRAGQLAELARLTRLAGSSARLPEVLGATLRTVVRALGAVSGSLLLPDPSTGGLRDAVLEGHVSDPLNHLPCKGAPSVAAALFHQGKGSCGPVAARESPVDKSLAGSGISSHLLMPVEAQGLQLGVLSLYRAEPAPPFDAGDQALFAAVAALVAITLETTRLRNLVQALRAAPQGMALSSAAAS
jgi:hypothetical protein